MLVLSRKKDESVCIGSNIEVKVLEVCGGRVRLGLCAPQKVEIQRREISSVPGARHFETWRDQDSVAELCHPA
ncbi:MAG: carbon storage regulator [Thermoguttaceae bacterium]|jgi:carbon storage regulator